MQAREIAVHFAMANLDLVNRPHFWTEVDKKKGWINIGGTHEDVPKFREYDPNLFGDLLSRAFPVLPPLDGIGADQAIKLMRNGELSFLFDECGNFICGHGACS